ncbi:MAG: ATP-binding protein [Actinomycetota bacterium]
MRSRPAPPPRLYRAILVAAFVAVQAAVAPVALLDPMSYPFGPPWNPVAGAAMALLLMGGRGMAAVVVAVVALAGWLTLDGGLLPHLAEGVLLAAVYGAAAHVLVGRLRLDPALGSLRDVVRLLAAAVLAAAVHALGLLPLRQGDAFGLTDTFLRLWAGDVLGVVVITPLAMLYLDGGPIPRPRTGNVLEGLSVALVLWIDFGLHAQQKFRFFYLLVMPLVWIAARHGLRGAAAGVALAQLGLLVAVREVPFRDQSLTLLQLIMLTFSVTTLLLGAVVSEQRRSRAALKDSKARLDAIVAMAPDAVLTIDADGAIESANPACEPLFGYGADDLVGRSVAVVLPALATVAGPMRQEAKAYRRDGTTVAVEVAVAPAELSDRRLQVAVVRDISQRKASEARLWEHQADLAHASRLSVSEKLATALAHQLNQPLAAVVGYTRASQRLLKVGTEPMATIHEAMDKAVDQALRAGEIIRRTREFLSSGDMTAARVSVAELAGDAARLAAPRYAGYDVGLRTAVPEGLPPVEVDPLQIEQVLGNLLNNALEAIVTTRAPIRDVCISATLLRRGWVEFTVKDSGPGIAPEVADRLFKPFTTSKANGMGMGLFIAQSIVEAHGGTMRVESRPGEGTAFSFTLPTAVEEP